MSNFFKIAAAQGEVYIRRISEVPMPMACRRIEPENGMLIVGHSETGHHHGFADDGSVDVLERTHDVPAGARILYAIVKDPTCLKQDAAHPHEQIRMEPGVYEMRIAREFDPFAEVIRQVSD